MFEAKKQQHLRSLRRNFNRAVSSLKRGEKVACHSGWGLGVCRSHGWVNGEDVPAPSEPDGTFLLLPSLESEVGPPGTNLIDEGVMDALRYFWPGPLHLRVRLEENFSRLTLAVPWHPVMQELLARHGPLLWTPSTAEESQRIESGEDTEISYLKWPQRDGRLNPTLLDISSRPWRVTELGFVRFDELCSKIPEPLVLSQERAFPTRGIRTYIPQGKTLVVETEKFSELPDAIAKLREQVPPNYSLRIYLDEGTAHTHFPDDREVKVYGDLVDLDRLRRRLQAMLERQNRRLGKRVLLIGIANLDADSETFRLDLEKLSDEWIKVDPGVEPLLPL